MRGHHVYKNVRSPYKGETLIAQPDNWDEAQNNDKHAVDIYEKNDDGSKELVGHPPVEFSSLLYHFLQASAENCINVVVTWKTKLEVGLVVPVKCNAFTRNKNVAIVLDEELPKRKRLYKSCLELKHQRKKFIGCFLYINNNDRIEYNTLSSCMLFLVLFKLTDKIPMNAPY